MSTKAAKATKGKAGRKKLTLGRETLKDLKSDRAKDVRGGANTLRNCM